MSFAMMLNDLGETEKAARLNAAILAQVAEGKVVTADIGGTAGTKEFTQAVIDRLEIKRLPPWGKLSAKPTDEGRPSGKNP